MIIPHAHSTFIKGKKLISTYHKCKNREKKNYPLDHTVFIQVNDALFLSQGCSTFVIFFLHHSFQIYTLIKIWLAESKGQFSTGLKRKTQQIPNICEHILNYWAIYYLYFCASCIKAKAFFFFIRAISFSLSLFLSVQGIHDFHCQSIKMKWSRSIVSFRHASSWALFIIPRGEWDS